MSSFTNALFSPTGKTMNSRIVWRCVGGFVYEIGKLGSGLAVAVPDGFETDGPSIPFLFTPLVNSGNMVRSSAVHDLLRSDPEFSLSEGNAIFFAAMQAEGVPTWQRWLCFLAVSLNSNRRTT